MHGSRTAGARDQGGTRIHGGHNVPGGKAVIEASELEEAVTEARKQIAKGPLVAWVRDYALVMLYDEVQRLNGDTAVQPLSERLKDDPGT